MEEMAQGIPVTYVPARNTSSCLLPWRGRRSWVPRISSLVSTRSTTAAIRLPPRVHRSVREDGESGHEGGCGRRLGLKIHTPLIQLTKAEIVRRGLELGVDYSLTRTCYEPTENGHACGACDACLLRLKGFAENGISDPAPYCSEAPAVA